MSRHIPESQLALYPRGDLGLWSRWRVERHLRHCEECAQLAREFASVHDELSGADADLPSELEGPAWNSLAAEMTANIRLGLAAGECVAPRFVLTARPRLTFALAGFAAVLVLAGLERPAGQQTVSRATMDVPTLEASGSSIAIEAGGRVLSIPVAAGTAGIRTVNTRGEIGSRNVDDSGGGVTITAVNLYEQ